MSSADRPHERIAFAMRLRPGCGAAYRERHDAIWPELVALLHGAGIRDYSIYLDPAHDTLFATLARPVDHGMDRLADEPMMRLWWEYMADLMETHPDASPVVVPLEPMFHLD